MCFRNRKTITAHKIKHCVKYRNFTQFPGVEILWNSPETMRKLCLSTKFPHQEISWNCGILRSESFRIKSEIFVLFFCFICFHYRKIVTEKFQNDMHRTVGVAVYVNHKGELSWYHFIITSLSYRDFVFHDEVFFLIFTTVSLFTILAVSKIDSSDC